MTALLPLCMIGAPLFVIAVFFALVFALKDDEHSKDDAPFVFQNADNLWNHRISHCKFGHVIRHLYWAVARLYFSSTDHYLLIDRIIPDCRQDGIP